MTTRPPLTQATFKTPYFLRNNNNGSIQRKTNGLVLVFDLDETIANFPRYLGSIENVINMRPENVDINSEIIKVFAAAIKGREEGKVDAILMLTNNGLSEYIKIVIKRLNKELGYKSNIFDKIFYASSEAPLDDIIFKGKSTRLFIPRNERSRLPEGTTNSIEKNLADVEYMLEELGIDNSNLYENVYFFDDMDHKIMEQINPYHYIHIHPFPELSYNLQTNYDQVVRDIENKVAGQQGGRAKGPTKAQLARAKGRKAVTRKGKKVMRRRRTAKK